MDLKIPKNDKYQWTQHSVYKMRQYGLSAQRIIRVIRNPQRIEEGIVSKTVAVMQKASQNKKSSGFYQKIYMSNVVCDLQILHMRKM